MWGRKSKSNDSRKGILTFKLGDMTIPTVIGNKIINTANQFGVDPNLALAVAHTESSFNPNAISPKGAVGLFQLMPSTAQELGVDPSNLDQNIQGGVMYLKKMLDMFGGDTGLALAAYNAGPGRVQQVIHGNSVLPDETVGYVAKIQGILGGMGSDNVPSDSNILPSDIGGIGGGETLPMAAGIGIGLVGLVLLSKLIGR